MQTVSALFRSILATDHFRNIYRAVINGTSYTSADMVEVKPNGRLFDVPDIGGINARALSITIFPKTVIPKAARIELYGQITDETRTSEEIPLGVYFISHRTEIDNGLLQIEAYDTLRRANYQFFRTGTWSDMTILAAAQKIAQDLGTTLTTDTVTMLAARTEMVTYPNDLLASDILEFIAVCCAANWTTTESGQLQLLPLAMAQETSLLIDQVGDYITFGGVRIIV